MSKKIQLKASKFSGLGNKILLVDLIKQHGLVIITKMQTSGRGRLGRKFISIPDKNDTFSVILHPVLPFEKIHKVLLR